MDAATRYCVAIPTALRANTKVHISRTLNECLHLHGRHPRVLIADNAKEFIGKEVTSECERLGVKLQLIVPHHPKQNSINERIYRTIYKAERSALSHSQLSDQHWDAEVLDATFKYNSIPHSVTKQIPHNAWFHVTSDLEHFVPFGNYGTVVNEIVQGKLSSHSEAVQYLYPVDRAHFQVIDIHNGRNQKVRAKDFRLYDKNLDPCTMTTSSPKAFKTNAAAYKRPIPTDIFSSTPAPANPAMARKYPDRAKWAIAHDSELDQLDEQKVATWCYHKKDLPPGAIVIPLTMHYRYKRNQLGDIAAYKANAQHVEIK